MSAVKLTKKIEALIASQSRQLASDVITAFASQLFETANPSVTLGGGGGGGGGVIAIKHTTKKYKKSHKKKAAPVAVVAASVPAPVAQASAPIGKKPLTEKQLKARRKSLKKARAARAQLRAAAAAPAPVVVAAPKAKKMAVAKKPVKRGRKKKAAVTAEITATPETMKQVNGHVATGPVASA